MSTAPDHDIIIVGGGLAGLSAAIQLNRKGYEVLLFEKETYPFHRVCGEYVSMESWVHLSNLGLPLNDLHLPLINRLQLTAVNGKAFECSLPLGGFGISRYLLDSSLACIAKDEGVKVFENTKVESVQPQENRFLVKVAGATYTTRCCLGAFGKRSNLDAKMNRGFLKHTRSRLTNFVGVKYHVHTSWPNNVIGLHNFSNGYCGISKIENNKFCVCYLTKAANLKGRSIRDMEQTVLFENPHLQKIFQEATIEESFPVSIAQISFQQKTKTEGGTIMLGDAAGMITPLCGNGMSIALHSATIASELVDKFLNNRISTAALAGLYEKEWRKQFGGRIMRGRLIQSFFGSNFLSNQFVSLFKRFPALAAPVIRSTHGRKFF